MIIAGVAARNPYEGWSLFDFLQALARLAVTERWNRIRWLRVHNMV